MTHIDINIPFIPIAAVTLVILIIVAFIISVLVIKSRKQNDEIQTINNLLKNTKAEFYILDIRSYETYKQGHLPGAINVPLNEIQSFFPTDEMFTDIIVYGANEKSSKQAAAYLSNTAYFCVRNMGSITRWKGKLETGSGKTGKEILTAL